MGNLSGKSCICRSNSSIYAQRNPYNNLAPCALRQLILILLLILVTARATAQSGNTPTLPDSLCHNLRVRTLIPTLVGVTAGTAITFLPVLRDVNPSTRDAVQGWRRQSGMANTFKHVDDIMQLAPAACVPLLKACGVPSRHDCWNICMRGMMTYTLVFITTATAKTWAEIPRPNNHNAHNSFFSGHTCTAFAGAEMLRLEYKDCSPWIGIGAYLACSLTGALRIYHDRHWLGDVLAGAGAGILCAQTSYWLCDRAQAWGDRNDEVPFTVQAPSLPRYELTAYER